MRTAFPDLVIKAEDIIASGDKVVTRWTINGTHKGMFMSVKPTGKKITIKGIIISRFVNGKVVEEWEEANGINIMNQLEVLPPTKN
jgi:predicted ester cyclase